jgi:hypothetical protein
LGTAVGFSTKRRPYPNMSTLSKAS